MFATNLYFHCTKYAVQGDLQEIYTLQGDLQEIYTVQGDLQEIYTVQGVLQEMMGIFTYASIFLKILVELRESFIVIEE